MTGDLGGLGIPVPEDDGDEDDGLFSLGDDVDWNPPIQGCGI